MPELPEVETVARGLAPVMEGRNFARVEQRRDNLRFPFPARFVPRLEGRTVCSLRRRAKYMLAELDDGATLLIHLGMTGRFTIDNGEGAGERRGSVGIGHNAEAPHEPHEHVVFHMEGKSNEEAARIGYCDPRRFGIMDLIDPGELGTHFLMAKLGVEPLGPELTPDYIKTAFSAKKAPLKAALLDQRIIAGLGNIYVCEVLHRIGLSPMRAASTLGGRGKGAKRSELVDAIRHTLEVAIKAGGSTLRDFAAADGSLGYFQHEFAAYGREGEPCLTSLCGGRISRVVQSGRSTFYCPDCQK